MVLWNRIVAFTVVAVMLVTLSSCSVIRAEETKPINETEGFKYSNTYNGYKDYEIGIYERLRAIDLLEDYGFTDYSLDEGRRHYNYTAEDFRSVVELDETYLYALYIICDVETFNTVLEALGYEDLMDYLMQMNYVDDEGKPNLLAWVVADMEMISEIMVEKSK